MTDKISSNNSVFVIIDIQEKLSDVVDSFDDVVSNVEKLIKSLDLLGVPIIVTEQYPQGLGGTVIELSQIIHHADKVEKTTFDCFNSKDFAKLIETKYKNVKHVILCGIESHVCVIQTALSALRKGFDVHVVADAISSRKKNDKKIAISRMQREGVKLTSTEMIIFQLIEDAKDEKFKELIKIIK